MRQTITGSKITISTPSTIMNQDSNFSPINPSP